MCFVAIDYVTQGMIANTGEKWKLFEQHNTIGMITEYILHPFAHLAGGHAAHMNMARMKHGPEMYALPMMKRRAIFVDVFSAGSQLTSPADDFDINASRTPLFYADVHLHTAEILKVLDTPSGSGRGTVPASILYHPANVESCGSIDLSIGILSIRRDIDDGIIIVMDAGGNAMVAKEPHTHGTIVVSVAYRQTRLMTISW